MAKKSICLFTIMFFGLIIITKGLENESATCQENEFKYNGYCRSKCPYFMKENNEERTCDYCATGEVAYKGNCYNKCPPDTISVDDTYCKSCDNINEYVYKNSCIQTCPNYTITSLDRYCIDCFNDLNNKYFFEGKCVDITECPSNSIKNHEEHWCLSCNYSAPFLFNNECIQNCPENTIIDFKNKICTSCDDDEFIEENKCVSKCSDGYSAEGKNCIACKSKNMKFQDGQCVPKCSGATIENDEFICEEGPEGEKKIQYGKFVEECLDNLGEKEINICYSCSDKNLYYYEGGCLSDCNQEEGLIKNDNLGICVKCKDQNKYLYSDSCVSSCPKGFGSNENGVCQECQSNLKSYNNICVTDDGSKMCDDKSCEDCPEEKPFFYGQQCKEKCPVNKIEKGNQCEYCGMKIVSLDQKECVDSCDGEGEGVITTEPMKDKTFCQKCSGYYSTKKRKCYYGSKCEDNLLTPNDGTKECLEKCQNSQYRYIGEKEKMDCYSKNDCIENLGFVDEENKICTICSKQSKNRILFNSHCVNECPEYTHEKEESAGKKCIFCKEDETLNKYLYDDKCINECPKGTYPDSRGVCLECMKDKYLLINEGQGYECVEKKFCIDNFFSIKYSKDGQRYCEKCSEEEYVFSGSNQCVSSCKGDNQFVKNNDKYNTKKCFSCKEEGKYFYNNYCYESCEEASTKNKIYLLEDSLSKVCYSPICSFKCLNGGSCDKELNVCKCPESYTGTYCEIKKEETKEKEIELYFKDFDSDDNGIFSFKTKFDISEIDLIEWDVSSIGTSLNGDNDRNVKVSFKNIKNGKYDVSVSVHNSKDGKTYKDKIEYYHDMLSEERFTQSVLYDKSEKFYAMKSQIKIQILDIKESESEMLGYQFFFIDIYNEELPLTKDISLSSVYEGKLPKTKDNQILVKISDMKGGTTSKIIQLPMEIIIEKDENIKVQSIVQDSNLSTNLKMMYIYNYLLMIDQFSMSLSDSDLKYIDEFSKSTLDKLTISNIILSILNTIVEKNSKDNLKIIKQIGNTLATNIQEISENEDLEMSNADIRGYYRNIDNILEVIHSAEKEEMNDTITEVVTETMIEMKKSIGMLNVQLSKNLVKGETMLITGMNFQTIVVSPSLKDMPFSLEKEHSLKFRRLSNTNDVKAYSPLTKPASLSSSPCGPKTGHLLCINQKEMIGLKNLIELRIAENKRESSKENTMSIGITEIDNISIYKALNITPISTFSISSALYVNGENLEEEIENEEVVKRKFRLMDENKETDNEEVQSLNELRYTVTYDIPVEIGFDSSFAANSSCVSFSELKKPKSLKRCKTYFNYEKKKTICKCSGTGEIIPIWDYTLSSLAKLAQFPHLSPKLFNVFNTTFVIASLFIMSILSIFFFSVDYMDDLYYKKQNPINEFITVAEIYKTNIYLLAYFATSYTYPFFNLFYLYDSHRPRFFRFLLFYFSSLLSILFSSLPFYNSDFTYKEVHVNKRDIETMKLNISNLPSQIADIIGSFLYSIAATVISSIIVFIFEMLLRFSTLLSFFWKQRKEALRKYVRMNYTYDKKKRKYLLFRRRFYLRVHALMLFGEEYFKEIERKTNRNVYLERRRESCQRKMTKKTSGKSAELIPVKRKNSNRDVRKLKTMKSIVIDPEKKSFTLNQYTINFELERKEQQRKCKNYYDQMEETQQKFTWGLKEKDEELITYEDEILEITYKENFSYFNKDKNQNVPNGTKTSEIIITFISVILLMGLFAVVYFYLFIIFGDIYQRYELYIVKSWLLPSLLNIIFIRILISYIKNLVFLIFIQSRYLTRHKNSLIKLVFKYVIPRYLVSIYKVKGIVDRYYNDFKEDVKKINGEEFVRKNLS